MTRLFPILACLLAVWLPGPITRPAQAQSAPRLASVQNWAGDFDGMLKRRAVRIIVPYSRTWFFIDRGRQMGVAAEFGQAFEQWLNARHKLGTLGLNVVFVPTRRDRMLDALEQGRGDIVAGNLTITAERDKRVDFAAPWLRNVSEVVVTGPASPALSGRDDLAGREIPVRLSSSYATHLSALNEDFARRGLKPVVVRPMPETLEDEDLLEMVGAGLLPLAVVDAHKAEVWTKVLPGLTLRKDIAVSTGGDIAWAIRENSPLLKAEIDAFFAQHQSGTSFGNTIIRRYFGGVKGVKAAASEGEIKKFRELVELFRTHGRTYSFDALMLAAQGYQESKLDQSRRSPRGAVGVMQLLPTTARAQPIAIDGVERDAGLNIEAGAKYMRHLRETYVNDAALSEQNRTLMTFAAYNAGPGNLRKFRRRAAEMGLDPNVWFNNTEHAAAKIVGRETVQYVSNIYKYYVAYTLATEVVEATR
jgi:membrane-bound lytic murein transglycosylase MltF